MNDLDRKAKLEKALADYDSDSMFTAENYKGAQIENERLAPLHAALIEAVEVLELSECLCHHKWTEKGDIFTKCFNCKALAKIDEALEGMGGK